MSSISSLEWFAYEDPDFEGFTNIHHTFRVDGRKAVVVSSVENRTFERLTNKEGFVKMLIQELIYERGEFIRENS